MIRVFVLTSDKYLWALRPFAYLFNIYWSELQPVVVGGFSRPDFKLPQNFKFHSIAPTNYPSDKWSDALIEFLRVYDDTHFVLLLEDYWLCRTVDVRGVAACHDYVINRPDVLRIDLTADRLYAGGMFDADYWGNYDIIETPTSTPYQMSTQAGIWNRARMLELLVRGKSAWEVEIQTQVPPNMRVLGTRQCPVRYANGILKGKLDLNQLGLITEEHRRRIFSVIPEDMDVSK